MARVREKIKENGIWKSVSDIIGSGTEVYSVDFFDIDDSDDVEVCGDFIHCCGYRCWHAS